MALILLQMFLCTCSDWRIVKEFLISKKWLFPRKKICLPDEVGRVSILSIVFWKPAKSVLTLDSILWGCRLYSLWFSNQNHSTEIPYVAMSKFSGHLVKSTLGIMWNSGQSYGPQKHIVGFLYALLIYDKQFNYMSSITPAFFAFFKSIFGVFCCVKWDNHVGGKTICCSFSNLASFRHPKVKGGTRCCSSFALLQHQRRSAAANQNADDAWMILTLVGAKMHCGWRQGAWFLCWFFSWLKGWAYGITKDYLS